MRLEWARQIHGGKGPTVQARVEMERSQKRGREGSGLGLNTLGLLETRCQEDIAVQTSTSEKTASSHASLLLLIPKVNCQRLSLPFFPPLHPLSNATSKRQAIPRRGRNERPLLNKRFK